MANLTVHPAQTLQGSLVVPGDKSVSHRAFLLGALSHGVSRISGCLDSEDVGRSRAAVEALGVPIKEEGKDLLLSGNGLEGLRAPKNPLDMGNSGTTTRLLMGILAGCPFQATLIGDASLSKRPMRRVTDPLEKMGAKIEIASEPAAPRNDIYLPLTIEGGKLRGIEHSLAVPSAQVKSALLLAGLHAEGPTTVVETVPTRDHTERMLRYLGAKISVIPAKAGIQVKTDPRFHGDDTSESRITVHPGTKLAARDIHVPGDFSSAAFFFAAAAMVPGSHVTVRGVGLNPTRTGFLELLKRMGAKISVIPAPDRSRGQAPAGIKVKTDPRLRGDDNKSEDEWEPVGDITVSHGSLKGITVEPQLIPNVIDELPALMAVATQANGLTRIEGAGELRVKETDRIGSMVAGLSAMGAKIRAEGDSILVEGPAKLKGASLDSFGDHRTAMALAVAALAADGETVISGSEWINISFPGFARLLEAIRR